MLQVGDLRTQLIKGAYIYELFAVQKPQTIY
jgi:hypothetical protein